MPSDEADRPEETSIELGTGEPRDRSTVVKIIEALAQTQSPELLDFDSLPRQQRRKAKKRSEKEKRDLEHERKEAELDSYKQDTLERKRYATRIFLLICGWLISLFVVLFFQGLSVWEFSLTDPVLLALIGGTTANVLGIFIIVTRYLFPDKRVKDDF